MYSLLYKLYFSCMRVKSYSNNIIVKRIAVKIVGLIEAYYNLYVTKKFKKHPSKKKGITSVKRKEKIIVSFTSYPKRIGTVWIVVETLLRQSMKPDEIILWLANSQFNGIDDVPIELRRLTERGLQIKFCDDLKSHKKYYYVMQEYHDDYVILVDDDTIYSKDLISKLWKYHMKYKEDIICMTPCMITDTFGSLPSTWRSPYNNERIVHSYFAQPYTGQGTLYPPHSLPEFAFNEKLIMDLCPFADDLWIKFMTLVNKKAVSAIYKFRSLPVAIYGTGESSLWYINGGDGGKNDIQWNNILNYYKEYAKDFENLK